MNFPYFQAAKSCLLAAAIALPALPLHAAPVVGPDGMAFYTLPASEGAQGDLIWYRQASVKLGNGAPDARSWNLMYHSSDALGQPNVVTGTVIVPTASWKGRGDRPVISYAVGTHGLNQSCAPSVTPEAGPDYEADSLVAKCRAGYADLIAGSPSYTNGEAPT